MQQTVSPCYTPTDAQQTSLRGAEQAPCSPINLYVLLATLLGVLKSTSKTSVINRLNRYSFLDSLSPKEPCVIRTQKLLNTDVFVLTTEESRQRKVNLNFPILSGIFPILSGVISGSSRSTQGAATGRW
jgi:hypothetical protein